LTGQSILQKQNGQPQKFILMQKILKAPGTGLVLMPSPYRSLTPKLNADPASATDIPKKNPLGAGATYLTGSR
jgi:hypothetical protein